MALEKLFHQSEQMEFLTQEDRKVLSALQHYYSPFQGSWYAFDSLKVLPLLVGHPRLFLLSDPSAPVEFMQEELEISVSGSGDSYVLSLNQELDGHTVQLMRKSATRFRILQITPEHRRIANIIGSTSCNVPLSGYQDLAATISKLSGLIIIHSDTLEHTQNALHVESDPRPCLYITPAGSGFRVNMSVRPLGASGPCLSPGKGQTNLLAEVQGQRMQTTRDLEEEESRARTVEQSCPSLSEF